MQGDMDDWQRRRDAEHGTGHGGGGGERRQRHGGYVHGQGEHGSDRVQIRGVESPIPRPQHE